MTNERSHSAGLKFHCLDLHVHTPASKCFADKSVTPKQIVERAVEQGLSGIAITDHNSAAWVDKVKAAARKVDLVIFPGAEISCKGGKTGLHVVALFDPSKTGRDVEHLLSKVDIAPVMHGKEEALSKHSVETVLEKIEECGALGVLAHANSSHGALKELQGQQRIALLENSAVSAVESTDFHHSDKESQKKRVVDWLDGSHPDFPGLPVYEASDNPDATSPGKHGLEGIGSRCSAFKLDSVDLGGLRQCFADPKVRIAVGGAVSAETSKRILSLTVNQGFLGGAHAALHPGLNSVLGGKGTGKSLLVELLRFGLDQVLDCEDPLFDDHDSKLESQLGIGGEVTVGFMGTDGAQRTVTRRYSPSEGNPYLDGSTDIARSFPVLFLSQGEIAQIVEDQSLQLGFIDRFFDFRAHVERLGSLHTELVELDERYAKTILRGRKLRHLQRDLSNAQQLLERRNKSIKNPAFAALELVENEGKAWAGVESNAGQIAKILEEAKIEVEAFDFAADDDDSPDISAAKAEIEKARVAVRGGLGDLLNGLQEVTRTVAKAKAPFNERHSQAKDDYDGAVQAEGGTAPLLAEQRSQALKEVERIEQEIHRLETQRASDLELAKKRTEKLDGYLGALQTYSDEREAKAKHLEAKSDAKLRIHIRRHANRKSFLMELSKLKVGSYLSDAEVKRIAEHTDPRALVEAILDHERSGSTEGLKSISEDCGIGEDRLQRLAEHLLQMDELGPLLAMQYQAVPADSPQIDYRRDDGKYVPLTSLSTGQKSTALLIMALSDGDMPVVIDQPEDSLDLRSIWEDMCLKVRGAKEERQFIFTTHNASLAVASDSDKFLVMEAGADSARISCSGSMDRSDVGADVLQYLEGGPDTYDLKRKKYRQ